MKKISLICILCILGLFLICPKVVKAEEKIIEGKVEDIKMYVSTEVVPLSFFRNGIIEEKTYVLTISYNNNLYKFEQEDYIPGFIKEGTSLNFKLENIYLKNGKVLSEIVGIAY